MADCHRLKVVSGRRPLLIVPCSIARELSIRTAGTYRIRYGALSVAARLKLDKNLPASELVASTALQEKLRLGIAPHYQLQVTQKEIQLGPLIGILLCKQANQLTERRMSRLRHYTRDYSRLNCSIVVFALDQIDREQRTVMGYLYNPRSDGWEPGCYPFPAAVYRRTGISSEWRDYIKRIVGSPMFNDYYWNKYELHQHLSLQPSVVAYLPETRLALTLADVQSMLTKHGSVFLKPVAGMRGRGAIQLTQERTGVSVRRSEVEGKTLIEGQEGLTRFLFEQVIGKHYLVQQRLDLLRWQGSVIDLRALMQKEDDCRWLCQGMVVRQGTKDSIVSNISRRGTAWQLPVFLRDCLGLNERKAMEWREQAEQLALLVCTAIDAQGWNNGIIGLDLGLDQQNKWWLIEANNRDPDSTIALDAGDPDLYKRLKQAPLLYAKGLAGFGPLE